MNYIYAQEKAGHNNFTNEKRAITNCISNELGELIEHPKELSVCLEFYYQYLHQL